MKIDITGYRSSGKIALGNDLKIIFVHINNIDDRKVLELNNVAGFFHKYEENTTLMWLRIDDIAGSYGEDLSMRLKRPEVATFKEVFLFKDKECVNFSFRAVAQWMQFRNWSDDDRWLK